MRASHLSRSTGFAAQADVVGPSASGNDNLKALGEDTNFAA
jgi:hypothetical protein